MILQKNLCCWIVRVILAFSKIRPFKNLSTSYGPYSRKSVINFFRGETLLNCEKYGAWIVGLGMSAWLVGKRYQKHRAQEAAKVTKEKEAQAN